MTITVAAPGVRDDGSFDVNIQSQTSPLFQYFIINELKDDILLTSVVSKDDEIINVDAGHGFTAAAGEMLILWESNRYLQMPVKSVATNAITVSHPVASAFTVAGAKVIRGNNLLNVNGSVTPVVFKMRIQDFTTPIDISKISVAMTHSAAGDDGKFGGIAALTNGIWFRKENEIDFNLGNYINNQSFKSLGGEVSYTQKGPGGTEATDIFFDLEKIFGQVIRMDSRLNDVFKAEVRDNLTGLDSFTVSLIGSYTRGE